MVPNTISMEINMENGGGRPLPESGAALFPETELILHEVESPPVDWSFVNDNLVSDLYSLLKCLLVIHIAMRTCIC